MKYADLHIHSSYSDGSLKPEKIIELARRRNVKCISITDHNSIVSQYITKKQVEDLEIIPGIEISTKFKEYEIHILGYYFDIENESLINALDSLYQKRIGRVEVILNKLKKIGINIGLEELLIDKDMSIGRGNIAEVMIKKEYVSNHKEAFNKYLAEGKYAFIEGEKLEYRQVIKLIHASGGIAVLAHPGKIYRSIMIQDIIKELKMYGIDGIEVYHPSHSREEINYFYNIGKKYNLLITGGSDFHKIEKEEKNIGDYGIDENLFNKILKYRNTIR